MPGHAVGFYGQGAAVSYPTAGAAIGAAVEGIRRFIRQGAIDPEVYALARAIVADCMERDRVCEAEAIRNWIRGNLRYVSDPVGVDFLSPARQTIRMRGGDCDDLTIAYGALAQSVGMPVLLILAGAPGVPVPSHVLPGIRGADGRVIPVELSGDVRFGRMAAGLRKMQVLAV